VLKLPGRHRLDRRLRDSIGCVTLLSGEDRVRFWLAVCVVLAGIGCARAQQTTTVPPPPPGLPSSFPQYQTYSGCVMNCDSKATTCQSTCSVNNSPSTTFPSSATIAASAGTRPDPGTLSQCYLACTNAQLSCKQTCSPPQ